MAQGLRSLVPKIRRFASLLVPKLFSLVIFQFYFIALLIRSKSFFLFFLRKRIRVWVSDIIVAHFCKIIRSALSVKFRGGKRRAKNIIANGTSHHDNVADVARTAVTVPGRVSI